MKHMSIDNATEGRPNHLQAVEVTRRGPQRQAAPRVLRNVDVATTPVTLTTLTTTTR